MNSNRHATKFVISIVLLLAGHSLAKTGNSGAVATESPPAELIESWIADGTLSTKLRTVKTLNVEAAKVLVKHKVAVGDRTLDLPGLTSITPEVARILSFREGGEAVGLHLDGLTTITPEVAEALATGQGGGLSLNGLTTISAEVAKRLSGVKRKLVLNGLKTLSREAAVELAKHKSKFTLTGLTEISDEAAEALSQHSQTMLLNGLTRLTSASLTATVLRSNDGFANFKKVQTISDGVAKVLAEYRGTKPIELPGLTELSEVNAALLRANQKIVLPSKFQKPEQQ
ncbi:MAG: hypothetical protein FJ386_14420 [Verrucomicrobia bacterium]|nr:hypothetical protein [Verrucomicrobiota bacterium]